jgi:DNA (cytosine-5)-methyltransferase 1
VTTLYNDTDPFAAAWLESLIAHGHIAPGQVDQRSITDLSPTDVAGPGQRHFFAGIGGWSHALRLAGVRDDADIWTGSCPCQPFSDAGKGEGIRDPRHLWPAWFALIAECRPPVLFGEQVASKDGLGWLDVVFADLERCGYTVGAADLCAAGVGAPHARQRLYFVAYSDRAGLEVERLEYAREERSAAERGGETESLADASRSGWSEGRQTKGGDGAGWRRGRICRQRLTR